MMPCRICQQLMKQKNYGDFLFSQEVNAEDVPNTPEKTRVSISGVVKQVNYLREKHY